MKSMRIVSSTLRRWQASSSSSYTATSSSSSQTFFLRQFSSTSTMGDEEGKTPLKRTDMKINVDISDDVYTVHSLSTANSKDILKHKISNHVKNLQIHQMDTGSTGVQSTFTYIHAHIL